MSTMGGILDLALIAMLSCFMPFHCRMVCLDETTIEGPSPRVQRGHEAQLEAGYG